MGFSAVQSGWANLKMLFPRSISAAESRHCDMRIHVEACSQSRLSIVSLSIDKIDAMHKYCRLYPGVSHVVVFGRKYGRVLVCFLEVNSIHEQCRTRNRGTLPVTEYNPSTSAASVLCC